MPDSTSASVLIVDDEPGMLRTLSAILEREGYVVTTAEDGERAVRLNEEQKFDVVLMDVRMPRKNGIEAFREISRQRPETRFILMSAYGQDDLKQVALEDGAIAFLDKPLEIDQVLRLIREAPEAAILIVDGDEPSGRNIAELLQQQDYHVTLVSSPADALELVEQIQFGIIFIEASLQSSDGRTPMNGLELYLAIRKITPSAVAIMLAEEQERSRELARTAVRNTAYTMVEKPVAPDIVLDLLGQIERQRNSKALKKPPMTD